MSTGRGHWASSAVVRWSFLLIVAIVISMTLVSRISRQPRDANGLYERGIREIENGRHRRAIAFFNRAAGLAPNRAEIFAARARAKEGAGGYRAAIADLDRALALAPGDGDALARRGSLRARLGDTEGAFDDYARAVESNPRNGRIRLSRAHTHFDEGNLAESRADLDAALRLLRGAPETRHAGCLRWLVAARMDDPDASRLLAEAFPPGADEGPSLLARMLAGEVPEERFSEWVAAHAGELDLAFYADWRFFTAGKRLLDGDRPGAVTSLRRCLDLGRAAGPSFDRAEVELHKLVLGFRSSAGPPGEETETVRVVQVVPDGPAGRAGIAVGDVVRTVDGEPVTPARLSALARETGRDREVVLEVLRDGESRTVRLAPGPLDD